MSAESNAGRGAFSILVVLAAVVVGVVAFAAFMVLIAFADDLRRPDDSGEHALSKSAVGFAGLVQLLQDTGHQVRVSRGPLHELAGSPEFAILSPPVSRPLAYEDFDGVWGWNLIVLPKWNTIPDIERPEWVHANGLLYMNVVERLLSDVSEGIRISRDNGNSPLVLVDDATGDTLPIGPIRSLQTISGDGIYPIITDPAGNIVLGSIGDPEDDDVMGYVLSDPDLLNTQGLASLATARTGMGMIDYMVDDATPIVFDMTLHGVERTRNILQLLLMPPFVAGVLCLVFAALLIGVTAFAGNLRTRAGRDIPLGHSTLVDSSARLVSIAGRSSSIGARYVAMIRRQSARIVGAPTNASEAQQIAILDSIGRARPGSTEPTFSQLSSDVAKASNPAAMMRAISRLYKWKQELGRDRKRR